MTRLDKLLAQSGGLSRSEATQAIRRGRVSVSGEIVRDPGRKVAEDVSLHLDDEPVNIVTGFRYVMLHKPVDYLCSHTSDTHHRTALDLIDLPHADRLSFAGRLDADTTGLVLLSDDGQWVHRIISPRLECPKTYLAQLADPIGDEMVAQLESGVLLRGESKPTRPARVEPISSHTCRLSITEGRYHQVKRMFAAVGNRVTGLHRERVGGLVLEETLRAGCWRLLTPEEVKLF